MNTSYYENILRVSFHYCLVLVVVLTGCSAPATTTIRATDEKNFVQAHAVLTVAEGKRLIAKGIAQMPAVQRAMRDGIVVVCKGTTNTYVAEELLGRNIEPGAMVLGHVLPQKGDKKLPPADPIKEVVFIKGQYHPELALDDVLPQIKPDDVIMKGGNALDYEHRTVGVWTGSKTGGTVGKIEPFMDRGTARVIIPIGLEKQITGRVSEVAEKVNSAIELLTNQPRMRILPGQIVTEIEALRILANVEAWQASAGGIGGAEGAVWLIWRGPKADVEKALDIIRGIQGEPPFIE